METDSKSDPIPIQNAQAPATRDFPSWRSYWQFARRVHTKSRYFRDPESQAFCDLVKETSDSRRITLPEGHTLYRSQIGQDDSDPDGQCYALPAERMIPRREKAVEGRANPKGIPYLYLASNVGTAIAESRAGVGQTVSVGSFSVTRTLAIVNCSASDGNFCFYWEEPEPAKRTEAVWHEIDRAFSNPVQRTEDSADYAPTQILAELFKEHGFDGIVFKSALGDGHNYVLFDLDVAKQRAGVPFTVKRIQVDFEQCGNAYSLSGTPQKGPATASEPLQPSPAGTDVPEKGSSDTAHATIDDRDSLNASTCPTNENKER